MRRYIVIRLLTGIGTLFVVSILIFGMSRITGNPVDLMLPIEASEADRELLEAALGLDNPLHVQYGIFISGIFRGDLGTSIRTKQPVLDLLLEKFPNSAKLATASMAVAIIISFPLGILAAVKRGTWIDSVARAVGVLGQATPSFWLGIILILVFSVWAGVLPTSGMGGIKNYIMPAFTLGWYVTAGMSRLLRSSMLEALDAEYIKLARIKGVAEYRVVLYHALRNSLIPVITFAGYFFAIFIGSSIITETVFAWPGIGRLAYDAVRWRDYPVIQAVVLLVTTLTILFSLLVDILYAYLDPRIRY